MNEINAARHRAAPVGAGSESEPQPKDRKAEPTFQVGDRVKIYRRSYLWECLWDKVGAVGTITGIINCTNTELRYQADFHDGHEWLVPEYVLCPASATESAPEPGNPQFQPFDPVLVRDRKDGIWYPALYAFCARSMDYPHFVIGGLSWRYCIPYEGNEALAGTTNDPGKGAV